MTGPSQPWQRSVAMLAVGLMALAGAVPARADVYRSCAAHYLVRTASAGDASAESAYFSAVGHDRSDPVAARRAARHALEVCAHDHWASPMSDRVPPSCGGGGPRAAGLVDYPLTNLLADVTRMICAANPGRARLTVSIQIVVAGGEGCTPPPDLWAIDLARAVTTVCPGPQTLAPAPELERVAPPEPAAREIVPRPELAPPPGSVPPLPGIRLPGADLRQLWVGDETWRDCQARCAAMPACRAWTWRAPGTSGPGSEAACLLKSTAGWQVPDACCHSGLKD